MNKAEVLITQPDATTHISMQYRSASRRSNFQLASLAKLPSKLSGHPVSSLKKIPNPLDFYSLQTEKLQKSESLKV